ncbi:MAG: PAS domain S-box protein [Rhodospirillaceae bacterium]
MIDAIETMPDGLAIFDKDDRFVRCNSHFRETFTGNTVALEPGTTFEAIIRGRTQFLWPKDSVEAQEERVRELLRQHRAQDAPLVSSTPNGKWTLTRTRRTADGGTVMVVTDITGVKQAEELLRRRENRLALIMDNVADALITIGPGGTIASFNRSAEQIFGYTSAEVIGQRFVSLFIDEEGGPQQGELARYILRGESAVVEKGPLEVVGRHKNGRPINIELVMTRAEEGGKAVLIGALRDTTERKAIQAQLQQAQKMEAVGQLTGGIAHDFNNLLGVVIGNLDLLKERVVGRSDEASLVDAALDSALRGADLNLRLLAFSRRQSLQPERIDVNDVVRGMRDLLQRAIGERIVISISPGRGIWPVEVDLAQLESAIVNLAVNARDAMPEGGNLTIETHNMIVDADHIESHPGGEIGEYVCITVSDTGSGMSPEVQARAFEPFFTTKPVGKGSGLGLSMVFGFMKQSNGFVNIYSEVDRGTVVRLYLPRTDQPVQVSELQQVEAGAPTGNERILLVEDNRAMGRVVMRQLEELGYQVTEAADANQALSILERGTPIDLLLTDVVMPGELDGIGLAHKVLGMRSGIKVLLASGFTARTDLASTPLPGRLLAKPFRKFHLAQAVRQALDEAPN